MANNPNDLLWVANPTNEPFTVKYAGYPFTLAAGNRTVVQRFIAEHFAKHLADSILLKKEREYELANPGKTRSFVNSKVMRPEAIKGIIVGVYSYHQKEANDPQAAIANMIDQSGQKQEGPKPVDLGAVNEDKAMGTLVDDEPDDEPLLPAPAAQMPPTPDVQLSGQSPTPQMPPAPAAAPLAQTAPAVPAPQPERTRQQLLDEAKKLGLKIDPSMTKEQIVAALQNF